MDNKLKSVIWAWTDFVFVEYTQRMKRTGISSFTQEIPALFNFRIWSATVYLSTLAVVLVPSV